MARSEAPGVPGGPRYAFDPLEQRGILLGLSAGQLLSLGAGGVVALLVASVVPGGDGLGVAVMILAAATLGTCWPLGGRPLLLWLPAVVGWACRRSAGAQLSPVPEGHFWSAPWIEGPAARRDSKTPGPAPARAIAPGIRLERLATAGGQTVFGTVRDLRRGTWSVVLRVRGNSFVLLDEDDKHRRLASWGSWLAGLARPDTPVVRVQWVERTRAADSQGLARYAERFGTGGPEDARRSYAELIEAAAPATEEHDTFVVLSFRPRRGWPGVATSRRAGVADVLAREARLFEGQLRAAHLSVDGWLSPAELADAVRTGLDARPPRPGPPKDGDGALNEAWPQATEEGWSMLRADGSWHVTYWVSEWPRTGVGPDFLAPLLLSGGRRRVSVVLAPVAASRAEREAQSARTADVADEELRSRAGFLIPARRRREAEGVLRREAELADGHAVYRFAAYVTVSEDSRAALDTSCARVEHAAQQARLELRRLYGRQAEAFGWTLPLGRGLA